MFFDYIRRKITNMLVLCAVLVTLTLWCEVKSCNETNIALLTGKVYEYLTIRLGVTDPGTSYTCVFEGFAPFRQKISVLCHPLSVMYDRECRYAKFLYSPSGDTDYADAVTHCGYRQSLNFTTVTNRVALKFIHTIPEDIPVPGYICFIGTPPPTLSRTPTVTSAQPKLPSTAPSVSNCDCGFENPGPRVVGGSAASPAEYPWMVGLVNKGIDEPFCGGTLISNHWVLTAAHCMEDEEMENVEVVLGTNTFGLKVKSGRRVKVSRVITHPYYNYSNTDNDIALLKLAVPVAYSNRISPVCLPYNLRHSDYEGSYGTVTGWGRASVQEDWSKVLKEVDLRIISFKECTFYYRGKQLLTITDNMFCTLRTDGQSGCDGDSGGPLTVQSKGRHIQLGIVSWGLLLCTDPLHPGVYSKVTNFLSWIEDNTEEKFCRVN